jgi:hypothetical protein
MIRAATAKKCARCSQPTPDVDKAEVSLVNQSGRDQVRTLHRAGVSKSEIAPALAGGVSENAIDLSAVIGKTRRPTAGVESVCEAVMAVASTCLSRSNKQEVFVGKNGALDTRK